MGSNFASAQISNKGGREINEDSTLSGREGESFCWVVADGLGGHGGGEDASRVACDAAIRSFQSEPTVSAEAVARHIQRADVAVRQMQLARPELSRMRTTVAILVADATQAVMGHVGDTRVYHLRAGRVLSQTRDHSVPQSLVDAGEIAPAEIRHHEDRSRLLRALGEEEPARPAVTPEPLPIGRGDAFLLCTDGFWEHVLETEMELDWAKVRHPADWLSAMQNRLQERVNGSHDNYTAVAVLGDGLPAAPAPTKARRERAERTRPAWSRMALQVIVLLVVPLLLLAAAVSLAPSRWKPETVEFSHKLVDKARAIVSTPAKGERKQP